MKNLSTKESLKLGEIIFYTCMFLPFKIIVMALFFEL